MADLSEGRECTIYNIKCFMSLNSSERELTGHWQWRRSWRDLWVKCQSRSQSDKGRILAADCVGNWPVGPDLNQGWSGHPGGYGPLTIHSQHQNYLDRIRETIY